LQQFARRWMQYARHFWQPRQHLCLPSVGLSSLLSHMLDCECNKFGTLPPSTDHCRGDKFIPRIYSGFFWDMSLVSRADKYSILASLDAPFSAVGDTLILPATLIQQVAIGNICGGNSGKKEVGAQACADPRQNAMNPSGRDACAPNPRPEAVSQEVR
jgi:hypothetical protein